MTGTARDVRSSRRRFEGRVISVRTDDVSMPDGSWVERDVVEHPGAVAVVALDDDGSIVLVEQYRHPIGARLWELPAGLLDVAGESAHEAAARELEEEAGVRAAVWHVLVDLLTSPGSSNEAIRVFLAEDLTEVDRPAGVHEEADLDVARMPLDAAAAQVLSGRIRNATACAGILAAAHVRAHGSSQLRAASSPWLDGMADP